MPPRRTRYTAPEIEGQLQQLWIYSLLSPTSAGEIELGPIILNIHKSKQQEAYLGALNQFVAEKEKEIEVVCQDNYQVGPLSIFGFELCHESVTADEFDVGFCF